MTEEEKEKSEFSTDDSAPESKPEESINLLPFLTLILLGIIIFQLWQINKLKQKLNTILTKQISADTIETRGYLKKLYEYYECKNYEESTSTSFQIYNLLVCLKERAEKKK